VLGILAATLLNHAVAATLGVWLAGLIPTEVLRWALGLLFIAMAVWALIPDCLADDAVKPARTAAQVFWVTAVAFFLAEVGDKTQIATAALAARFDALAAVVAGTTLGMLVADVPAVYAGRLAGRRFAAGWVRYVAAGLFAGLGVATLVWGR
jgi:putative Ca2+/H+ antiporter (TMEM165/GDT1 family)